MQLQPREYFTIARGIENHTDAGTYYIQAVIRNAKTDALIDTVNLTDQGNRRFSYAWQVPADTSGEGFYILITTTVYEDASYMTKSANYGEQFETYLVQARVNPNLGIGGGGGLDIDYKKLRAIVQEELAALPEPPEPQVDLRPILAELQTITGKFDAIPRVQPVNLKPVMDAIILVKDAVQAIPKPEKVDYKAIRGTTAEVEAQVQQVLDKTQSFFDNITKFFVEDKDQTIEEIRQILGTVLTKTDLQKLLGVRQPEEPQPQPVKKTRIGL